jgi:TRAP-type C4-dicarboxylate transport system permease small subunit
MRHFRSLSLALTLSLLLATPALADSSADLVKIQNFIQNIIQILVTVAGFLAAGFFVMGGIGYITSSGNPEHLEKSKRTIIYSALGLAIAIGAFVLSDIISQVATTAFGH